MILKEITLLTLDEYLECNPNISPIGAYWWLKTPHSHVNGAVFAIDDHNSVDWISTFNTNVGVRPVGVFNISFSNPLFWYKPGKIIGSKIIYGNFSWTIFETYKKEIKAICDNIIDYRCFDTNGGKIWANSDIKTWLEKEGLMLIKE